MTAKRYYRPGDRVISQGSDTDPAPWPEVEIVARIMPGWFRVRFDDGHTEDHGGRHLFPLGAREAVEAWHATLVEYRAIGNALRELFDREQAALETAHDERRRAVFGTSGINRRLSATADAAFAASPYVR